jgi:hypothetical protein
VEKLASTQEGDGTLLDRVIVVYGSGLADGDKHTHEELPVAIVGGRRVVGGGRHLVAAKETPMTNLFLTLLDQLGVPPSRSATARDGSRSLSRRLTGSSTTSPARQPSLATRR